MRRFFAAIVAVVLSFPLFAQNPAASTASVKPKVRAITAFVRLDRGTWEKQITEALTVLRKAQKEFEFAGYQVESIRITSWWRAFRRTMRWPC